MRRNRSDRRSSGGARAALAAFAGLFALGGGGSDTAQLAQAQLLQATAPPVWNIRPDAHQAVARHTHAPLDFFGWDDDEASDDGYEIRGDGVAVIRVCGVLVDAEPSWWMSYLGYASTPLVTRQLKEAAANQNVKKIALHIDSPGGSVSGLADACDAAWQVRQDGMDLYAVCKQACSAAFEIASQTKRIYLTQDGMAGCIGTLYTLRDWSGYYSSQGIVTYGIASTGAETYKGAGMPGIKVTEAHQADFKRMADEYRTLFNGIIQRGRGWDDATMKTLADGRSHVGTNALTLGLVDEITTVEDALSKIGAGDANVEGKEAAPPGEDDGDAEDAAKTATIDDTKGTAVTDTVLVTAPNNAGTKPDPPAAPAAVENTSKEQPMDGKELLEKIKALVSGGGSDAGADTPATNNAETTEAENTRLKAENKALTEFRDGELTQAKKDAGAAAVTAFGQGTDALKNAQAVIDSLTDVSAVRGYTQTLAGSRPTALTGGNGARQSQGTDEAPSAEGEGEGATDADYYNNLRKEQQLRQERANGTDRDARYASLVGKKDGGR